MALRGEPIEPDGVGFPRRSGPPLPPALGDPTDCQAGGPCSRRALALRSSRVASGSAAATSKGPGRARNRLAQARVVHAFAVPGLGGGFIAVDTVVAGLTAGGIRVGALGKHYDNIVDAREETMELAAAMTRKCKANKLNFGGCKTVLYFLDASLVTSPMEVGSPRAKLFNGLAEALAPMIDRILVGPDLYTTFEDLAYLRARCCQLYPTMAKNPVPHAVATDASLVATATAHGLYGALTTLAKKKGWVRPTAVIQGLGAVGGRVYDLLLKDSWTLYAGDVVPELLECVPEEFRLNDEEIFCEPCDVFVPCAVGGVLSLSNIEKLQCKAVAGCANLQIPVDAMSECKISLSNRGIEYYDEILLNGGGVQSAIFSFRLETFKYEDSYQMCSRNMDVMMYEQSVMSSYDTDENRKLYATIMGDGTDNIHFGLWDDAEIQVCGPTCGMTPYGKASVRMTEYMWQEAMQRSTVPFGKTTNYIDLGAGNGSSARHIVGTNFAVHATCLNLCPNQNRENRERIAEVGLEASVTVADGTFERMPDEWTATFDGAFSQDSFVHAFSKRNALSEALRIVKGGGWLVVSDMHCGYGEDVSKQELQHFAQTNMVNDWLTPDAMVAAAREVGWVDVQFVDLTAHIKTSFQLMLKKVTDMLASGQHEGMNLSVLETHKCRLEKRDAQIDLGVFKWGALLARKPFEVFFASSTNVVPEAIPPMVKFMPFGSDVSASVDAVVVTIMDEVDIDLLPPSTRCIVSMSAGLDHLDLGKADARGIVVRQAGREAIVSSVADYLTSIIIFGLRNGFENIGARVPEKGWNLSWNADGIDIHEATIGIIGMGRIAQALVEQLHKMTPCSPRLTQRGRIVYHVPAERRRFALEEEYSLQWVSLDELFSSSDVVLPLCSLNPTTENMVGYEQLRSMKKTACLVNASRGKVCNTEELTKAMQEGLIRHAVLDTTHPEPLPNDHPILKLKNVTILPHFATNTTFVRQALVDEIPNLVLGSLGNVFDQGEDCCEVTNIVRTQEAEEIESKLRSDLAIAYKLTRLYNSDALLWSHISARLPVGFLMSPRCMWFDEIQPSDVVKSSDNITGGIIHEVVFEVRPDVGSIVHWHTPAAVAVSCLEEGFMCLTQDSAPFYEKVAYHEWEGPSDDPEEKERLAEAVQGGCNTLVMRNHSFCTFGSTVQEAWVLAYYFERACETQMALLATGQKIRKPDPKVMAHAAKQALLPGLAPGCEWDALFVSLAPSRALTARARSGASAAPRHGQHSWHSW